MQNAVKMADNEKHGKWGVAQSLGKDSEKSFYTHTHTTDQNVKRVHEKNNRPTVMHNPNNNVE